MPTFVHVTVHVTVAPAFAGFGTQLTVLVMSAPADGPFTGTTVLESLLLVSTSLLALVVAGTVIDPATVGVKLTVHASVPPGATFALGEQLATGAPGNPLVLIEQLAAVAVTVPTFSQIAVQVIGEPTTPGVGVQLTVLTMSDPVGCAMIATVSVPLLLPNAPDGSFVAPVVEFTVTVPGAVAVKITLQPRLLPAATSTGAVAFGHTTVAPAGKLAAFVTEHVAPSAVTVLTLVQVTAQETVAPTVAGSGVQTTVLAMSACVPTVTVAVALSHAVGTAVEQIVYGTVYVPGVVFAATVMVPLAFITMLPVAGGVLTVPGVSVTLADGVSAAPATPTVSLPSTDVAVVPPATPPILPRLSFSASMMATEPLLPLLPVTVSLLAPVVPVTATAVSGVSPPPAVPGITIVTGQVSVAPTGKLAAVPALATQAPVLTPTPLATQVALVATAGPLLVHTMLPVTVLPGAATAGTVMALTMSALVSETTIVTIAVSHAVGTACAQIWYCTV